MEAHTLVDHHLAVEVVERAHAEVAVFQQFGDGDGPVVNAVEKRRHRRGLIQGVRLRSVVMYSVHALPMGQHGSRPAAERACAVSELVSGPRSSAPRPRVIGGRAYRSARGPSGPVSPVPCEHDRRRGLHRSELSVGLGHFPLDRRGSAERDLSVTWRSYCLEIRDDYGVAPTVPQTYRQQALDAHAVSHRMLRIFEAARADEGEEAVDRLYTEWGARNFAKVRPEAEELLADCLAAAGLPPALKAAAEDEKWDAPIREAMEVAYAFGGPKTQTPTVVVRADSPHGFKGTRVWLPPPQDRTRSDCGMPSRSSRQHEGFFEVTRPRTNLPRLHEPRLKKRPG